MKYHVSVAMAVLQDSTVNAGLLKRALLNDKPRAHELAYRMQAI